MLIKAERSQRVDFIRGLALLGILFIYSQLNSLVTSLRSQQIYGLDRSDSSTPIQFFIHLLVNGPVSCLISIGFGWRFYWQWQRGQQAGMNADWIIR